MKILIVLLGLFLGACAVKHSPNASLVTFDIAHQGGGEDLLAQIGRQAL